EAGLEREPILDRAPVEASLELSPDRAAGLPREIPQPDARPRVARGRELERSVAQHRSPARLRPEREPDAGRAQVAARERAVDALRREVEAALAEQRVVAVVAVVERILVAARMVGLQQEDRRPSRGERVAEFPVVEVRLVIETDPPDAGGGRARLAPLPHRLDLVTPMTRLARPEEAKSERIEIARSAVVPRPVAPVHPEPEELRV